MNKKEFVIVLTLTFIVILIWIAADIILVKPSVPQDPKIEAAAQEINPNFDKEALEIVSKTQPAAQLTPLNIPTTPQPAASPQPILTPSPEASQSASPSATPLLSP